MSFLLLLSDGIPGAAVLNTAVAADGSVTLSWTAGSGATDYDVKYGILTGTYTTTLSSIGNVTSRVVSGLTNGATYFFVVVAKNSYGSAVNSNELSASPVAANSPPATPVQTAPDAGDGQVTLHWNAAAGATNYDIRWGTSTGLHPNTAPSVGNVTSYVHTGRVNGQTLYYVIVATNAFGLSAESNEYSVTPVAATAAPPTPTLRAVIPGATSLLIEWDTVPSASTYTIKYGTSAGTHGTSITGLTGSSYTITGLTNGLVYYVVIVAVNGLGSSADSNEKSAAPRAGSYPQFKFNNFQLGDIGFFQKDFKVEYYRIEQHDAADAGKVYKTVTVDGKTAYEYRVTRDLDGTGPNDWDTGDSTVNTGVAGLGHIEQYAFSSVYAKHLSFLVNQHAGTYTDIDAESTVFEINLRTVNDAFYVGMTNTRFTEVYFNLLQAVAGTGITFALEYWNGSSWAALTASPLVDGVAPVTHPFLNTGSLGWTWTAPSNWAKTTVNSANNGYYIRIRTTAVTTWTANGLNGRQPVVRGRALYGPTIVGWRRKSSEPTDVKEAWVVGNLKSTYDYGGNIMGFAAGDYGGAWVGLDAQNGMRMMAGSVMKGQIRTDGTWTFYGNDTNYITWDGTQLLLKGVVNITGAGSNVATQNDITAVYNAATTHSDSHADSVAATAQVNAITAADGQQKNFLTQITNIPGPLQAPGVGSGLYLTASSFGFYNYAYYTGPGQMTEWRTYINNSGQFIFRGNSGALLAWDGNILYGSNGSTVQWGTDATTGEIYFGGGAGRLSSAGLYFTASYYGSYDQRTAIRFGTACAIFAEEYLIDVAAQITRLWITNRGLGSATVGDAYTGSIILQAGGSIYAPSIYMDDTGEINGSGTRILGKLTATGKAYFTDEANFAQAITGSVGIGLAHSDVQYSRLQVDGGAKVKGAYAGWGFEQRDNTSNSWVLYANSNQAAIFMNQDLVRFDSSGNASKLSAGTAWTSFSDTRVKDVRGEYAGGLSEILRVRPIVYDYNGLRDTIPNGRANVGVLAQEIREIFPNMITEDDDGYLMLDPTELTYALVNAVKELSAQVKALQAG